VKKFNQVRERREGGKGRGGGSGAGEDEDLLALLVTDGGLVELADELRVAALTGQLLTVGSGLAGSFFAARALILLDGGLQKDKSGEGEGGEGGEVT